MSVVESALLSALPRPSSAVSRLPLTVPRLPSAWQGKDPDDEHLRIIVDSCNGAERERLKQQVPTHTWLKQFLNTTAKEQQQDQQRRVHSVHNFIRTVHLLRCCSGATSNELASAVVQYRKQFARQFPKLAEFIALITESWTPLGRISTLQAFLSLAAKLDVVMQRLEQECALASRTRKNV